MKYLFLAIVVLLAGAVTALVVLYFKNDDFKAAVQKLGGNKNTVTRNLSPQELAEVVTYIGACMAARGYVPQNQSQWLWVYQKQERPSALVAIILFLFCFIPGVIYLAMGGGTSVVSVQVYQAGEGLGFAVVAPWGVRRMVHRCLLPYVAPQG